MNAMSNSEKTRTTRETREITPCIGLMKSLDPEFYTYHLMNMSYYTDSTLLQAMMENPLEKKAGRPHHQSKKIYVFRARTLSQRDP